MVNVKPEVNDNAYWFLAQHPRGLQNIWLDYLKHRIFKIRRGHPNYGPDAVETQAVVELLDRDCKYGRMEHTKFRFHPINNLQHQAAVLHEIREHPLTESLQVVIFEEKFDSELFQGTIVADMKDWIRKIFFNRLTKAVNFVDEVQKAMELYAIFNPTINYNPLKVVCSLTIELDNKEFREWLPSMLDWQSVEKDILLPRGEVTTSLAHALTEIAWNTGYPEWVVGQRELINNERNCDDDTIVHLKCHFSTRRMALGLEVLSDEEFHPFLDYTVCNKSATLCAYVALIMAPKPGQLVLDLAMNIQDYMMAIFHNYDYLNYISVVNNRDHYDYSLWNAYQMKRFYRQFTGKDTNHHDFIHLKHWSHIEHQDVLLGQVDRLLLPVPYMERPYTEDLDELLICIKMDYDIVLRIANKMRLGSRIMLIFNRIDADYVYQIMTPDIACLQITWAKTVFDREEYLIVMEVERVPAPAPASPLIGRLEQASLQLQGLVEQNPVKMEVDAPIMPRILLEDRKRVIPPSLLKPKPLALPKKVIIPPKPKKTPQKLILPKPAKKTPDFIRRKAAVKRPRDPNQPGPSREYRPPPTPLDQVVIPVLNSHMTPMEPLLRAMAIMSARQAAARGEKPLSQRIPKIEVSSRSDDSPPPPPPARQAPPPVSELLKTPVKYPVKLKKSPRIQEQEKLRTPQKAQGLLKPARPAPPQGVQNPRPPQPLLVQKPARPAPPQGVQNPRPPQPLLAQKPARPAQSQPVQKPRPPPPAQKPPSGPAQKLPTGLFSTKIPVQRAQPHPVPVLPPVSRIPPPGIVKTRALPPPPKKPAPGQLFSTKVPVRVQQYPVPALPPVPRYPPSNLVTPRPPPMIKSPREPRAGRTEPPQTRTQAAKSDAKEKKVEATLKSPTRIQPIRSPRQAEKTPSTPRAQATGPSPGPASRTRTAEAAATSKPKDKSKNPEPKTTPKSPGILSPGRRKTVEKSGTISAITSPGRTRASAAATTPTAGGSKTKAVKTPETPKTRGKEKETETLKTPKQPAIRHSPRTQQKRSSKRIAAKEKEVKKKK